MRSAEFTYALECVCLECAGQIPRVLICVACSRHIKNKAKFRRCPCTSDTFHNDSSH
ncbi:hypothetical protein Y023_5680 [Burkholderia pseudomallei A79D]|nr:hypothetical protein Y023_5680 [Burkholderia pseudomallei A79D]KGX95415.1 hypothetical protein X997_5521 [Burkholderia pseudomallei A79C]